MSNEGKNRFKLINWLNGILNISDRPTESMSIHDLIDECLKYGQSEIKSSYKSSSGDFSISIVLENKSMKKSCVNAEPEKKGI